jgi:hypothetical protein
MNLNNFFPKLLFLLIAALIAFSLYFPAKMIYGMFASSGQRDELLKTGVVATGTITNVEDTRVTFNNNPQVKLTLSVQASGSAEFTTSTTMVVSRVNVPRVGDHVKVHFNPNDHSQIAIE